jgi:hypothetical protein
MTVIVLRIDDRESCLNSLVQAFRARGDFDFFFVAVRIVVSNHPRPGVVVRRTRLQQSAGRFEDLSQYETRRVLADRDERWTTAARLQQEAPRGAASAAG